MLMIEFLIERSRSHSYHTRMHRNIKNADTNTKKSDVVERGTQFVDGVDPREHHIFDRSGEDVVSARGCLEQEAVTSFVVGRRTRTHHRFHQDACIQTFASK